LFFFSENNYRNFIADYKCQENAKNGSKKGNQFIYF